MKYFDLSTVDDPEDLVYDACPDFEGVTGEVIEDQSRWSTHYSKVVQYKDGTYWQANWSRGSTEYQDDGVEDLILVQVEPVQVTVTQYKAV